MFSIPYVFLINRVFDVNYFPRCKRVEVWKGPLNSSMDLKVDSKEYNNILNRLNMSDIKVEKMCKLYNYYLKRSFELKKEKKCKENSFIKPEELILYHGTEENSTQNILKQNFNWRMSGSRSHHCYYGKGVYFTQNASVCRRYPKRAIGVRYMILSKVLFTSGMIGNELMKIPPFGFDTTFSKNLYELVKYEDNEFYPTHLISFIIKSDEAENSSITLDSGTSQSEFVLQCCVLPSFQPSSNETEELDENERRQHNPIVKETGVDEKASNVEMTSYHSFSCASHSKYDWSYDEDRYSDTSEASSYERFQSEEDTEDSDENFQESRSDHSFSLNPWNTLKSFFIKTETDDMDSDYSADE